MRSCAPKVGDCKLSLPRQVVTVFKIASTHITAWQRGVLTSACVLACCLLISYSSVPDPCMDSAKAETFSIGTASVDKRLSLVISVQQFQLTGPSYWVIFASRLDREEAIELARSFTPIAGPMRVFSTTNGWYAVATGPINISSMDEFRRIMNQQRNAPKDAFPSTGKGLIQEIWQSPLATAQTVAPNIANSDRNYLQSVPETSDKIAQKPQATAVSPDSPDSQQHSTAPFTLISIVSLYILGKTALFLAKRHNLIRRFGRETGLKILAHKVWQGMTSEQLIASWGRPADIGRDIYKDRVKETWKYHKTGKNRFSDRIYVNDGIVVGWKE